MAVVFPEKLLDYEWLLHYNACISLCSGDYKHDPTALLLRWMEPRGQGTRRWRGGERQWADGRWILLALLRKTNTALSDISSFTLCWPPRNCKHKQSFYLWHLWENAFANLGDHLYHLASEYFKKPWKQVSWPVSRCTDRAFQLVCMSSSMYEITDSHHTWLSDKWGIITLAPLLLPPESVIKQVPHAF